MDGNKVDGTITIYRDINNIALNIKCRKKMNWQNIKLKIHSKAMRQKWPDRNYFSFI